jgi:hypothetical protein
LRRPTARRSRSSRSTSAERPGGRVGRSGAPRAVPHAGDPSATLFAQEPQVDLGSDGIALWTDAVTQVKAG